MSQNAKYSRTYQILFNKSTPQLVTWETSNANIISPARGFIDRFDFTMQLQVGCPGGCLFCYVPNASRLTPLDVRGQSGKNWGFLIRNKKNIISKLEKHLINGDL